ncbi:MAG: hypothetical protein LBU64_04460 [Planctomycetota bacterium]|jgi:hypothetical protein|nr:hypothetical protein [Planctomycetota bacterium]
MVGMIAIGILYVILYSIGKKIVSLSACIVITLIVAILFSLLVGEFSPFRIIIAFIIFFPPLYGEKVFAIIGYVAITVLSLSAHYFRMQ